jgi:hypothetical protein
MPRNPGTPLTRLGQGDYERECNGDGEGSTLLWFGALCAAGLAIVVAVEIYESFAASGGARVSAPSAAASSNGGAQ